MAALCFGPTARGSEPPEREAPLIDKAQTVARLEAHVRELTETIGERSVFLPANLERTARYIETFYASIGIATERETYAYRDFTVSNILAEPTPSSTSFRRYVLGAHYDSVSGTVGADDNASAVAVQLEVMRHLAERFHEGRSEIAVQAVSFALEEPPVYGTRHMGSKIRAKNAKKAGERIDGMICLEMVGYTCRAPGCQDYPFPLMFMDYPKTGDFIGIVGDFSSRRLTVGLYHAFRRNPDLPAVRLTVPLGGWILPTVRLSDHASFWDQGFRAVMVTDSAFYRNPYYHTPLDTVDKLDFPFMAELVESLLLFFLGPPAR